MTYRLIPRTEWKPRLDLFHPQPRRPVGVYLHWTVTTPTANPHADARKVEDIGGARFGRMSYSFLYHPPTRSIIEGAGYTIGAHTAGHNSTTIAVSIIGAPGHDNFPHLVDDIGSFLRDEIAAGRIEPSATIRGHRDQKSTECPGDKAYALLPALRTAILTKPAKPAPTPQKETVMDDEIKAEFAKVHTAIKAVKDDTKNARQDANEVLSILLGNGKRAFMFWRRFATAGGKKAAAIVRSLDPGELDDLDPDAAKVLTAPVEAGQADEVEAGDSHRPA